MASPLSVGDCIAIANIILKGYQALAGTSEDARILNGVRGDLERIRDVLQSLSITEIPTTASFQKVLRGCFDNLLLFQSFTSKYAPDSSSRLASIVKRLKYSFFGKKELEIYRQGLQQSLLALLLLQVDRQNVISTAGSKEIKQDIYRGSKNLELQIWKATGQLKVDIGKAIVEPWDIKPIRFQDACGRRYPIPLEVCDSFEDFIQFLLFVFKKDDLVWRLVSHKQFWLFTPPKNGNADKWWYLINEDDWSSLSRPDMQLSMSLDFAHTRIPSQVEFGQPSPNRMLDYPAADPVRFALPTPMWNTLPDSLEFKWLSSHAKFGSISMKPDGATPRLPPKLITDSDMKRVRNICACLPTEWQKEPGCIMLDRTKHMRSWTRNALLSREPCSDDADTSDELDGLEKTDKPYGADTSDEHGIG